MGEASDSYRRIWQAVREIPRGRVATYGQVAEAAGLPKQARQAGYALHALPKDTDVPWHRVVNAQGKLSFPPRSKAYREQRQRLEAEGIVFIGGRIDLQRHGRAATLDEMLWGPKG
jgi:methylated-DNA-protein-cysteine methyltransferase related protein